MSDQYFKRLLDQNHSGKECSKVTSWWVNNKKEQYTLKHEIFLQFSAKIEQISNNNASKIIGAYEDCMWQIENISELIVIKNAEEISTILIAISQF